MKRITDNDFNYIPSVKTNVRNTFIRVSPEYSQWLQSKQKPASEQSTKTPNAQNLRIRTNTANLKGV